MYIYIYLCLLLFLADDEQSDFFHESGPTCGISGVIPWWENEGVNSSDESMVSDRQFQQILNGSFNHLSRSSQIGFKARMTRIMRHVCTPYLYNEHLMSDRAIIV